MGMNSQPWVLSVFALYWCLCIESVCVCVFIMNLFMENWDEVGFISVL